MNMRLLAMTVMGCTLFSGESFAQDVNNPLKAAIKQQYLRTLTAPPDFDDPNYLGAYYHKYGNDYLFSFAKGWDLSKIMSSLRAENLNQDPEIQKALIAIRNYHPITSTRLLASSALEDKTSSAQTKILVGSVDTNGRKGINKTRKYCTSESVGAKALTTAPEALIDELTPIYDSGIDDDKVQDVDIFAKEVSGGWLTGYGKVPSLGLHYVPRDKSLDTSFLIGGTVHTIIEKSDSDSFLVLSNTSRVATAWSNICPSFLEVSEVTETAEGEFEVKLLRQLPQRVQKITQMENGELFVSFGTTCFSRGIESPKEGPFAQDQYFFNPPVGVTATGHIYDVCEMDSNKRRW